MRYSPADVGRCGVGSLALAAIFFGASAYFDRASENKAMAIAFFIMGVAFAGVAGVSLVLASWLCYRRSLSEAQLLLNANPQSSHLEDAMQNGHARPDDSREEFNNSSPYFNAVSSLTVTT